MVPPAWAQSPVGDDRWHRNQGADKMEGMCRDHSQAPPRVVRQVGGPRCRGSRTWKSGSPSGGRHEEDKKSLPREEETWGKGDIMSPKVTWKGGCLIQGVTQRTESRQKGRGVTKENLSSGNQRGGLVR